MKQRTRLPRFTALALLTFATVSASFAPLTRAQVPQATTAPILQIVRLQAGTGAAVTAGQKAVVQYTGWLYEEAAPGHRGAKFDSSLPRGAPFTFTVGDHMVIAGWDQGVLGMKVGEKRELTIPAELGYGARGANGVIPPNATLVFEVELVGIE
jgi:FKBP-type peptidyl-prolyl cis-trans isomerase